MSMELAVQLQEHDTMPKGTNCTTQMKIYGSEEKTSNDWSKPLECTTLW